MNVPHQSVLQPLSLANGLKLKNRVVALSQIHNESQCCACHSNGGLPPAISSINNAGMVITSLKHIVSAGPNTTTKSLSGTPCIHCLQHLATLTRASGAKAVLRLFDYAAPEVVHHNSKQTPFTFNQNGNSDPTTLFNDFVALYVQQTELAIEAGFDGIELDFFNPIFMRNLMAHNYGKATRNFLEQLQTILEFPLLLFRHLQNMIMTRTTSPFSLGIHIHAYESDTFCFDDIVSIAKVFEQKGIDYLHVSLKNFAQTSMISTENQSLIISRLSQALDDKTTLVVSGKIKTFGDATSVLALGASLVVIEGE